MAMSWLVYGLLASVFFGVNAVVYKYAAVNGRLNPFYASIFLGVGILLSFIIAYVFNFSVPTTNIRWLGLTLFAGVLLGLGFIMVAIAISNNADVAKLTPIYNMNTLIAVILGILVLKELPSAASALKVLAGAVLVVIGSILVGLK